MSDAYSFITELIEFFRTGETGLSLTKTVRKTDRKALRIVVIKLLAWLKRESKNKTVRPYSLNHDFPWCNTLITLVKDDEGFRSLLVINDNAVALNPNIPEDESAKITAACATAYNPPLMR